MRLKTFIAVGTVALLATGCGSDAVPDQPLAGPLLPQKLIPLGKRPPLEPKSSPAADATFSDNVEYELEKKTLSLANAPGRTSAECPDDLASKAGTVVTCTSTYEDAKVGWTVSIGESGWSENVVEYVATPRNGLITSAGVGNIMFGNNSDLTYALCNDIPTAVAVPMGPTKYKCEKVIKGKEPFGYNQTVHATDTGPRVY
ncbi:hypothetical protein GCM10010271_72000 [Streptomyces kurssanovii]|nr:hypothetical protein GCM10010271_72000 [Streptomyces kurssanovii]